MGHDYVDYAGRSVVFRDPMLNLMRCIMHRVADDPQTGIPDRFRSRLLARLQEFRYVCNGVFTDFRLDELLAIKQDADDFLRFLDICASFVVSQGSILRQDYLNDLVGDSDDWNVDLEVDYPLLGFGRLANLVAGAEPCVGGGVHSNWAFDGLSPRMKQERLAEHRRNS